MLIKTIFKNSLKIFAASILLGGIFNNPAESSTRLTACAPSGTVANLSEEADPCFFTPEMLNRGYLASSKIVFSLAHNRKIIDKYIRTSIMIFRQIQSYINSGKSLPLLGPEKHKTFKRLTGNKDG